MQDDSTVHQGSSLGSSGRPIVDLTAEETSTSGQQQSYTHFLCVSPDAPTNPVLYWLGNFDNKTSSFLLDKAKGPLQLDLGDILYAPNLMVDDKVTSYTFRRGQRHKPSSQTLVQAWVSKLIDLPPSVQHLNKSIMSEHCPLLCRVATFYGGGCRSGGK